MLTQLLVLLVMFGGAAALTWASRRWSNALSTAIASSATIRAASTPTGHAQYTAGAIAERLRLEITSGEASDDLMMLPARLVVVPARGAREERSVRLQGAPRGRLIEVLDHLRKENEPESWLGGTFTLRTWERMHVGAQLRIVVPELEIASRRSTLQPIERQLALPPTSSGEPALDGEFVFATTDARAAIAAAPILSQLDPALRAFGIHLVCADGWLRFVFDRGRFGGSLYFAEQLVWALEHVADRIEALASAAPAPPHSRASYDAPRTMRSR